jgi:hypothetical protein
VNSWKYDNLGGVKTGDLALYKPSKGLQDYHFHFTGEIEKKSLGWVFRAVDLQNYYAVKLQTIKSGRIPTIALLRYSVINGKESRRTQVRLPMQVDRDTVYHVDMDVNGQLFTVSIQGHVVDFWSDGRLKAGAIGFFSGKGEQARLQAVRLTHQYDALGRLCAFLSLQDPQSPQSGVPK